MLTLLKSNPWWLDKLSESTVTMCIFLALLVTFKSGLIFSYWTSATRRVRAALFHTGENQPLAIRETWEQKQEQTRANLHTHTHTKKTHSTCSKKSRGGFSVKAWMKPTLHVYYLSHERVVRERGRRKSAEGCNSATKCKQTNYWQQLTRWGKKKEAWQQGWGETQTSAPLKTNMAPKLWSNWRVVSDRVGERNQASLIISIWRSHSLDKIPTWRQEEIPRPE